MWSPIDLDLRAQMDSTDGGPQLTDGQQQYWSPMVAKSTINTSPPTRPYGITVFTYIQIWRSRND